MKEFVGKTLTRKVPFMDGEVEVRVLTVADAKAVEARSKAINENNPEEQIEILRFVIRMAVVGAEELTDEEIDGFPVQELTKLSESVMGMEEQGNG